MHIFIGLILHIFKVVFLLSSFVQFPMENKTRRKFLQNGEGKTKKVRCEAEILRTKCLQNNDMLSPPTNNDLCYVEKCHTRGCD